MHDFIPQLVIQTPKTSPNFTPHKHTPKPKKTYEEVLGEDETKRVQINFGGGRRRRRRREEDEKKNLYRIRLIYFTHHNPDSKKLQSSR